MNKNCSKSDFAKAFKKKKSSKRMRKDTVMVMLDQWINLKDHDLIKRTGNKLHKLNAFLLIFL